MGMTFKKKDSLEKLFEEFAIDPDKKENEKAINKSAQFKVDVNNAIVTFKDNEKAINKSAQFKVDVNNAIVTFKDNEKSDSK